jgi:hypothetical protein
MDAFVPNCASLVARFFSQKFADFLPLASFISNLETGHTMFNRPPLNCPDQVMGKRFGGA